MQLLSELVFAHIIIGDENYLFSSPSWKQEGEVFYRLANELFCGIFTLVVFYIRRHLMRTITAKKEDGPFLGRHPFSIFLYIPVYLAILVCLAFLVKIFK